MPLLRIKQHIEQEDHYRVEIDFKDDDGSEQTAEARFEFALTRQDRADIRWYLEDYLQYPMDPAPEIAARVEARIRELGVDLFRKVFQSNDETRDLWATLRERLDDTRVEVVTDVKGATALPWELLCDPKTDAHLALRTSAFVRAYPKAVQKAQKLGTAEKVRILLVMCRPGGSDDVPFRSVAGKLIKGLSDEVRETFELDVLRPPTFEQLSKTLHEAKSQGRPYHIIHFDGHGGYVDLAKVKGPELLRGLMPTILGGLPRSGPHGYLLFENPREEDNIEWVDGPSLGKLMVDTDAPVLVLNACRSAHAAPLDEPDVAQEVDDPHSQVRAFGSLAQEVMDAGVAGVVAMRYNVYVVTAAQFVADLYAALASGQTLGEAVSLGRKQLAAQPLREIAFEARPLQDWSVPLVYEAAPIQLFPKSSGMGTVPAPKIDITQTAKPADDLPRPDVGFFGRDETLLALDRAFDTQQIVLLHAYAGSGKTSTAAEFARWYEQTGGLSNHLSPRERGEAGGGTILYSKFETYLPLERVLDTVEQVFRQLLEANNIQWLAMETEQRKQITFQILKQIPVLWIWDNIEPVNGFPAGTQSAWANEEQKELRDFLQQMGAQTKAKFLLTSRRDERAWLGELPCRVILPAMPMQERVQLARALAEKHGHRITDVEDWRPLLAFTQGNPLTITVLVGQALRDGLKTKSAIRQFVEKLRKGEAAFHDEISEGRSKSLGASLSYGFESAFSEEERRVLALLHFFQGFVDVDVLKLMIVADDWGIGPKNFTHETGIALLDKAAEIGLITPHNGGYYIIHPVLPWFFHALFEQYYPADIPPSSSFSLSPSRLALHAFVESMGELSNYYHDQYGRGKRDVIALLRAEEANLLRARMLAHQYDWYPQIISTMQGLRILYDHTGRHAEWKRLVDEITSTFIGSDDLPLPNRETQWGHVIEYRVHLAEEARDWLTAERLQRLCVSWDRQKAALLLKNPPEMLNENEKNTLRSLTISFHELGEIQRELGLPNCVENYQEALVLAEKIADGPVAAICAFNIGRVYQELPTLRNLDEAERWYQRSMELHSLDDQLGRGNCSNQLGLNAYQRFKDAEKEGKTQDMLTNHLTIAIGYYQQALTLLPPDAVYNLSMVYRNLGNVHEIMADFENSLKYFAQSIHYSETGGNLYEAGQTRFNVARSLARNGRFSDALLYAHAALRNFESYGQGATNDIEKTEWLIGKIEQERTK